ncbi:MAG TPA: competence/damage-inducible protein A [Acidimicrobiales bacterium]
MRVEIVAVGTELLLGQVVDTNSSWMSERLAESGLDCNFQVKVGDNLDRIAAAIRGSLARADAVIVCGGLGPTQDDITREAIAAVMGVELIREPEVLRAIEAVFADRGRPMSPSNARQADVPKGGRIISLVGTAPGLICPVGEQVIYAVPGVPWEMRAMLEDAVLPDLRSRGGMASVIMSRTLRTWGLGESVLAETVTPRLDALDALGAGAPTIAFLASGVEGIKLRVTVKADDAAAAAAALDAEEAALREILGDVVFGVDDETMEASVGKLLVEQGLTLGLAESYTGGLIASRIVAVPGASGWFTGGLVSYQSAVKFSVLGLPEGPVVSLEAVTAMASGVRDLLSCDVALATTGVAGPDPQDGHEPGTVFVGVALPGEEPFGRSLQLFGGRGGIREMGTITSLDYLRQRLLTRGRSNSHQ